MPFFELRAPAWIYGMYYAASPAEPVTVELPLWAANRAWDEVDGPATVPSPPRAPLHEGGSYMPDTPPDPKVARAPRLGTRRPRTVEELRAEGLNPEQIKAYLERTAQGQTSKVLDARPMTPEQKAQHEADAAAFMGGGAPLAPEMKTPNEIQAEKDAREKGALKGGAFDPTPPKRK